MYCSTRSHTGTRMTKDEVVCAEGELENRKTRRTQGEIIIKKSMAPLLLHVGLGWFLGSLSHYYCSSVLHVQLLCSAGSGLACSYFCCSFRSLGGALNSESASGSCHPPLALARERTHSCKRNSQNRYFNPSPVRFLRRVSR